MERAYLRQLQYEGEWFSQLFYEIIDKTMLTKEYMLQNIMYMN